jgi:hypothetical protein
VLTTNFLLVYTGYGLFFGPVTIALISLEWRRKHILSRGCWDAIYFLLSLLSFMSFFVTYRNLPTMGCRLPPRSELINQFWFAVIMFANFAGLKVGSALFASLLAGGAMLIATLFAAFFLLRKTIAARTVPFVTGAVPLAFISYTLLFSFAAAMGRACLGLGIAASSRYVTPLIVGFFGLYLGALTMQNQFWKWTYVAILWIVALSGSAYLSRQDLQSMVEYSNAKLAWKQCYLASKDIKFCTEASRFQVIPARDGSYMDDARLRRKLDFLEENHLNLYGD